MTTVRSRVREGFLEVSGPGLTGVVEAAERHADALANAASEGPVHLLDLLCSRGLLVMPAFGIVVTEADRVRVLLRGAVVLEQADGRVLAADGREPWRDVDVEDAGDEVVLATPQPRPARGWRRPSRLAATGAGAAAVPHTGDGADDVPDTSSTAGNTRADDPDPLDVAISRPDDEDGEPEPVVEPDPEPVVEPEPEPVVESDPEPVAEAEPEPVPEPEPAPEPEPEQVATPPVPPADLTLPPPEDGSGSAPVDRVPPSPPPSTAIIDSVPWRRAGGSETPAPAAPTERFDTPPPPPADAAPAAEAAPAPDAAPGPEAAPAADQPADETAAPDSYPAPEATPRPDATEAPVADVTTARGSLPQNDEDLDRPVVLAVLCPAGHHSAPHAGRCRTCGREIPPQQPTPIPRPTLGVLRISTGGVVPLDRGVLLGRAPRVNEELPPSQRPHLIRVGGVDRDISRNHAEVVLEGWHVLVRDLGSTNGTTVALPGEEPVRLRPTEDQGIEPGSVITLADEVSLTYEVDG